MHHSEDKDWISEEEPQNLSLPVYNKQFVAVMRQHYNERLRELESKGDKGSTQYYFVRNSLNHYVKHF